MKPQNKPTAGDVQLQGFETSIKFEPSNQNIYIDDQFQMSD
jgi:hypothetical protein